MYLFTYYKKIYIIYTSSAYIYYSVVSSSLLECTIYCYCCIRMICCKRHAYTVHIRTRA